MLLHNVTRLLRSGTPACCHHTAMQVVELLWTADRLGLEPIVCLQHPYNLLHRWEVEPELLGVFRRYGLGLMTYSPLVIGLLSGRFRQGQGPPVDALWDQEWLQVIQTLVDLAAERGTPGPSL